MKVKIKIKNNKFTFNMASDQAMCIVMMAQEYEKAYAESQAEFAVNTSENTEAFAVPGWKQIALDAAELEKKFRKFNEYKELTKQEDAEC